MVTRSSTSELIEWILQYFSTSFTITSDHLHYLQSTFGTQNLSEVLEQGMDCELESFLALLCYPDQEVFSHYEAHWWDDRFTNDDLNHILDYFSLNPTSIRIEQPSLPDATPLTVELPPHIVHAFIYQLKINRSIPSPLAGCLSALGNPSQQAVFRSIIRHAPFAWHLNQILLVQRFVEKAVPRPDPQIPLFKALITLLPELAPDLDGETFLLSKKAQYRLSLTRAEDFERRRQHQAMEILMSQGVRAGFGSVIDWQRRLAMIDSLFHHLFGRLPVVEGPEGFYYESEQSEHADR